MSPRRTLLEPEEVQAVRAAVAAAEAASGAEIVPVLVAAVDSHEEALWKGALIGALAGALAGAVELAGHAAWAPPGLRVLLPVTAGALVGGALAWWPPLRRLLVGRARLEAQVERAAREAFLAHEVFATRDRTGLLIFVALFERSVAVVADSGVHAAVPAEQWQVLAQSVAREMSTGSPARALLAAVERAGAVVGAQGPRRRSDDVNELPDAPIVGPG
jgi:putative membrane protein